jgi:hypothetical protein
LGEKRWRAAAVQDAGARFNCLSLFGGYGIFENALTQRRDRTFNFCAFGGQANCGMEYYFSLSVVGVNG